MQVNIDTRWLHPKRKEEEEEEEKKKERACSPSGAKFHVRATRALH